MDGPSPTASEVVGAMEYLHATNVRLREQIAELHARQQVQATQGAHLYGYPVGGMRTFGFAPKAPTPAIVPNQENRDSSGAVKAEPNGIVPPGSAVKQEVANPMPGAPVPAGSANPFEASAAGANIATLLTSMNPERIGVNDLRILLQATEKKGQVQNTAGIGQEASVKRELAPAALAGNVPSRQACR